MATGRGSFSRRLGVGVDVEVEVSAPPEAVESLVAAVRAGDRAAAARLFERFAPEVRRLLQRTFGRRRDTDDLLHDTFVNVFRDLGRLRSPELARFFILSIAVNIVRNQLRRDKVRSLVGLTASGELPEPRVSDTTEPGLRVVARRRLFAHLARLSSTDRIIFALRHNEELSVIEVASALGISVATVKRRLRKTTERLAREVRRDPLLAGLIVTRAAGADE